MARIPTLQDGALPVVPPSPEPAGGGRALGGLAHQLEVLAERQNRRADFQTYEAAGTAGGLAGDADPGAQMQGGGDLYRSAFNRQATEAGLRRLQIQSRDQLDQLAREHEADPEGFARKAAAYRDGIASGLPETMRAPWLQGFDTQAQPYANQARATLERRTADEAVASFNELLPRRIAALERLAGQSARGDQAATRALEQEQAGLLNDLARLGPRTGFTLGGREFAPDPSRTGARSVAQLQEMFSAAEQRRLDADILARFRAGGSTRAWIEDWRRQQLGETGPSPHGGRVLATPEQLTARIPEAWRETIIRAAEATKLPPDLLAALIGQESGGKAGAVSRAGAVGPAQIMPDTARNPGFGLPPLPLEDRTNPDKAIPWAANYLAALRDHFQGDMAKALAAYNAGVGRVERGGELPQETRDYVTTLMRALGGPVPGSATPGSATPGAPAMPAEEVRRIERLLNSEAANDERALRERQQLARAGLEPLLRENAAAIAETGKPVHQITDAQLSAAGIDPAGITRFRAGERAAILGFQAGEELRAADTPEKIAAIAARFAPGTDLFAADPAAASRILDRARARGVEVRGAAITQKVADLTAEAQASGTARPITREDGAAAGLKPEEVDRINRDLERTAELSRIHREGLSQSPADRSATRDRLRVEGEQAAENAARLQAYERAWTAHDRGIKDDPAGFALMGSKPAQALAQRVAGGELDALPQLVAVLDAEQQRMGVATGDRRTLPRPMAEALTQRIMQGASAGDRVAATRALLDGIPEGPARRQVLDALGAAGLPEGVRLAAGAQPRIGAVRAARMADELDTKAAQLNVTPQLRKDATTQADAVFNGEAGWFGGAPGLGTLRAAQYQATGQAAFLRAAEEARDRLVRMALVRGAGAGGSPSRSDTAGAYDDLFGGVQIIQRPGVLVAAPKGTDADALVRGLAAVRDRELLRLFPGETAGARQAREAAARGTWVDAGNGFAFYPPNTGAPLPGADGRPLVVTAEQAQAAPPETTAPQNGGMDARAAGARAQLRESQRLGAASREWLNRGQP